FPPPLTGLIHVEQTIPALRFASRRALIPLRPSGACWNRLRKFLRRASECDAHAWAIGGLRTLAEDRWLQPLEKLRFPRASRLALLRRTNAIFSDFGCWSVFCFLTREPNESSFMRNLSSLLSTICVALIAAFATTFAA